jgi:hypothetical protein
MTTSFAQLIDRLSSTLGQIALLAALPVAAAAILSQVV